jgi:hypothetical protein
VSDGGGLYNGYAAKAALNNCTVYGNSAQVAGGIENDGSLSLNSTTISNNAGGIYNDRNDVRVVLQDSILASNGTNCTGTVISKGYNLSDDESCNLNGPGDLNNTEPKLGSLQNNGGPTQTMAEFLGSPTVDAGNPNGCTDYKGHLLTTDQRGAPRPGKNKQNPRCDMGAFERQSD